MKETNIAFSAQFKRIRYDFSAEKISSDGGVLILNNIERKHKILRDFISVIPDYRSSLLIKHDLLKMLKQRTYLLALGYEDCDDSDTLCKDPIISMVIGSDLASQRGLQAKPENIYSAQA
jgi:hypothetical protein